MGFCLFFLWPYYCPYIFRRFLISIDIFSRKVEWSSSRRWTVVVPQTDRSISFHHVFGDVFRSEHVVVRRRSVDFPVSNSFSCFFFILSKLVEVIICQDGKSCSANGYKYIQSSTWRLFRLTSVNGVNRRKGSRTCNYGGLRILFWFIFREKMEKFFSFYFCQFDGCQEFHVVTGRACDTKHCRHSPWLSLKQKEWKGGIFKYDLISLRMTSLFFFPKPEDKLVSLFTKRKCSSVER